MDMDSIALDYRIDIRMVTAFYRMVNVVEFLPAQGLQIELRWMQTHGSICHVCLLYTGCISRNLIKKLEHLLHSSMAH